MRLIGRLEYLTWNDNTIGEFRSRAVILASQVVLVVDRAYSGLGQELEPEEQTIEVVHYHGQSSRPSPSVDARSRPPIVPWERWGEQPHPISFPGAG